MSDEQIIAIGLLTANDLEKLGPMFARAYPVNDAKCFEDLLAAIDRADDDLQKHSERLNPHS